MGRRKDRLSTSIIGTAMGDHVATARLSMALAARQDAEKKLERTGAPFES